jgi:hypothetical protein
MGITIALIGVLIWASPKYGNKTVMIDLGLVGLFGEYSKISWFQITNSIKVDIRPFQPKVLRQCFRPRFGEP